MRALDPTHSSLPPCASRAARARCAASRSSPSSQVCSVPPRRGRRPRSATAAARASTRRPMERSTRPTTTRLSAPPKTASRSCPGTAYPPSPSPRGSWTPPPPSRVRTCTTGSRGANRATGRRGPPCCGSTADREVRPSWGGCTEGLRADIEAALHDGGESGLSVPPSQQHSFFPQAHYNYA